MTTPWNEEMNLMKILNMTDELLNLIPDQSDDNNNNNKNHGKICIDSILDLGQSYKLVHGYIALIICLFGTIANILNLIVLNKMSSPINRILTALAFTDMLVMLEYIPFAIHMYIIPKQNFSYKWAIFVLFHSHFTQILHTISIQLTLTMAVWRYLAIRFSSPHSSYCTFKRCNQCILASYICPLFFCIPNYLTFTIHHKKGYFLNDPYGAIITNKILPDKKLFINLCEIIKNIDCIKSIHQIDKYIVELSDMAKAHGGLLHGIHFWTFSVFIKLIPCVILTILMCWLLNTLYKVKRRHALLQQNNGTRIKLKNLAMNNEITEQSHVLVTIEKSNNCNNIINNENTHDLNEIMIDQEQLFNIQQSSTCGIVVVGDNGDDNKNNKIGFHSFNKIFLKKTNNYNTKKMNNNNKNYKRNDRTSHMLIAVLCLFIITEFPQGIMACLSGFYGEEFFRYCYSTWAEVWDILALFNSSVNFILYCFMSRQFRLQFQQLFILHSPIWITKCSTIVSTTTV